MNISFLNAKTLNHLKDRHIKHKVLSISYKPTKSERIKQCKTWNCFK